MCTGLSDKVQKPSNYECYTHSNEPSIPKLFNHEDDKCEVGSKTGKSLTFYCPSSKS
jgi:hypothetical protein